MPAANVTKANLLCETGTLYLGPVGEPLPEFSDLTPPSITADTPAGNWVNVGATQDNHEFQIKQVREPIVVNESRIIIKNCFTEEGGMFLVKLAEKSATRISQALSALGTLSTVAAGAGQTAQDVFTMGDKASPTEVALLYITTNQAGGSRLVHIPTAQQVEDVSIVRSKKQEGISTKWEILATVANAAGSRMFTIYDVTAVATS